jgi:hypothetical protein
MSPFQGLRMLGGRGQGWRPSLVDDRPFGASAFGNLAAGEGFGC